MDFLKPPLRECVTCVCVCARVLVQDKAKEKSSRFDTLRHSLAGMIRSPKTVLGSSTSVSFGMKISLPVVTSLHEVLF